MSEQFSQFNYRLKPPPPPPPTTTTTSSIRPTIVVQIFSPLKTPGNLNNYEPLEIPDVRAFGI